MRSGAPSTTPSRTSQPASAPGERRWHGRPPVLVVTTSIDEGVLPVAAAAPAEGLYTQAAMVTAWAASRSGPAATWSAELVRIDEISAGDRVGLTERISATTPATIGAEKEVPLTGTTPPARESPASWVPGA